MMIWQNVFALLVSLAFRFFLEKKAGLAVAENLLLIALSQCSDLCWVTVLTIVAFFLASAFCQMELEYAQTVQRTNACDASLCGTAKPRTSSCSARTNHLEREKSYYCDPQEAQVAKQNNTPQVAKALHGRVTMFPCDLRHLRQSGFRNKFHHSYLYVGYPVGLSACYSPLISVEPQIRPASWLPINKAWFSVRPEHHGFNGGADRSMTQKLEEFLSTKGKDLTTWPYAYILTLPSVTRQLNNPLSFCYLYDSHKKLDAMIVQLQTSYGERRLWLLGNCSDDTSKSGQYCFREEFGKDLQVSPFTPPEATYVIESSDPCAAPLDQLNIKVTLRKEGQAILRATVKSTGPPLDAATASLGSSLLFLMKWWWVPMRFVVVLRILFQAAKIYFTHNDEQLNVQTRAEPIKTAVAKSARISERILEKYFHRILQTMMKNQSRIKSLRYITSGEHCERIRIIHSRPRHPGEPDSIEAATTKMETDPEKPEQIDFQVNTPAFYARFFHYRSPLAAIQSELLDDKRTRTAWSSHPHLFAALFPHDHEAVWRQPPDWRWRLISILRGAPTKTNFPRQTAYEPCQGISLTDVIVAEHCSKDQLRTYRRILVRVFLGRWIGGFSIGPIKEGDFELIGLSRDAVLMIHDAFMKALIVTGAILVGGNGAWRPATTAYLLCMMLSVAGLNLWACLKAIF